MRSLFSLAFSGWLLLSQPLLPADCSLKTAPDRFLGREARAAAAVHANASKFRGTRATVPASSIPRVNVIDHEIFGKLEEQGVASAPLSTDDEFIRRIYFDLTGVPPAPDKIRAFIESSDPSKRDLLINELLASQEFTAKWSQWVGDLLLNVAFPQNFDRQYKGRNAYFRYSLAVLDDNISLRQLAIDAISATGNNYDATAGGTNFVLNGITPMGPIQDSYDNAMRVAVTQFLGLSNYDCLLCHDGRNRLNLVNLWGSRVTRVDAQRMAAFFSRTTWTKPRLATTEPYYNSYDVTDRTTGGYVLNTNFGNRPNREPLNGSNQLLPEYRDGRTPQSDQWRREFAQFLVEDPMFSINLANRLWKQMFTLALAEPVDALDPARLDPENPPPAPWTLQSAHTPLLRALAAEFDGMNYDLRSFLRLIAQSSAYQLSSRYSGEWKLDSVPLFARHYPRRLEGEEVHDAILKITGVGAVYRLNDLPDVLTAMALPEPMEPRSNGAVRNFMDAFYRGNRDSFFRIPDGSIQQQLNLMNDSFVLNRVRASSSPTLRAIVEIEDNAAVIDELFLLVLSRRPDERERSVAAAYLERAGTQRFSYIEDLAWALLNKTDFLFNY